MREVVLSLYKDKKCSDIIKLEKGENVIYIQPYSSELDGLQLIFKYPDGKKKTLPIHETAVARTIENVSLFESFWFEYHTSDKNYFVNVELN